MTTARRTAFLVAAVYLFAPAHPDAFFRGIPLGLAPLVVLAVGVFAWFVFRDVPESPRTWTRVAVLLACLLAVKIGAAFLAPPVGWVGRYYPNDRFAGPARRSTDFVRLNATRIDRAIDFKDDYFPAYFLNEADFNRGIRREVTLPVTAAWTGHVHPSSPVVLPLALSVRGKAAVKVDGQTVMVADSSRPQTREVTLSPGDHQIDVTYLKPADTDPLIALRGFDLPSRGDLLVTPEPVSEWRRAAYRVTAVIALAADAMAAFAFVLVLWRLAAARRAEPVIGAGGPLVAVRTLCVSMFAIYLVQGVYAAVPHLHRAVSLSGGDDWLGFEARAREVVTGGLLMRFGRPLGSGEVFYYYPGYSYFLAGVHWLTGEDLSGVLFVHFILLFLANVTVFRIAEALFSRPIAVASTIALVGIEELAFMRHYTVTLLSENLYFLTVPLTVLGLVRFLQSGRRRPLVWAGLAAGVSAITRPAMMLFLVPAALIILAASAPGGRRYRSIAASLGVFIACWFGVVFLITLRNYVVAGQPILISESPAHSFILYNLPPTADARHYMAMYSGGLRSAAQVMLRIIVDHPGDSLRGVTTKIGFSFGMIQWMGGSMHPELVLASALYLAALLSCSAARTMFTWPVHAFIAAHLLAMVLTMPSNYGYRLILPMYLFLPMFGARFVEAMTTWARGRAPRELAVVPSGGQRR